MKKIVATAIAAAMLLPVATPALARPDNDKHSGWSQGHQWHKGDRFDRRHATYYQVVDYHRYHHLYAPPRGYHWVRSGSDAVLVGITSGIIAAVIANQF